MVIWSAGHLVSVIYVTYGARSRSMSYIRLGPSACRLSVTFVRPTPQVEIFGNVSTSFSTSAIH